jgi:hypothetical protein
MWHGTILKDTTKIIFNRPEVIPKLRPNPSPSHNDVEAMVNSALERQAKSTDELLRKLIEERDGKSKILLVLILFLLALIVLLKLIHTWVVHRRATLQCQTLLPSWWTTFTTEPPSRVWLLLLWCHRKLWPTCLGKGICTLHLALLYQTLVRPHIPPGVTVEHTVTLMPTTKPHTPP